MILVIRPYPLERGVDVVVGPSAGLPPRQYALDEDGVVTVHVQCQLRFAAHGDEITGVLRRTGESVEEYALAGVVLHLLLHECDHDRRGD